MSGIAAIVNFDGTPVEPEAIVGMTDAMAYRGIDGVAHWQHSYVALGHCQLRTTDESFEEVQPLVSEDQGVALVFDGWLSNWLELRKALLHKNVQLRTRSDAELVLRAYQVWGQECCAHLDGEFAFLVWDNQRREVFLARDHAGLRPLHYHWNGKHLVIASDIGALLRAPGVERRPNRGLISEYYAADWHSQDETIWQGISRAPAAYWMRFSLGRADKGQYWDVPHDKYLEYKRDDEYFEHYRELFADCVRRTSRSCFPLACDVSGGLDSSANFAMAQQLRDQGRLLAPGLHGYTYDLAGDQYADEVEFARAVGKHWGATIKEVKPFLPPLSWFIERSAAYSDFAGFPNGAMAVAIGKALVTDGCRVSLNGEGGDQWLSGTPLYYAEHLKAGEMGSVWSRLVGDTRALGLRETVWRLLRYGIAPLVPEPLRALRHNMSHRHEQARAENPFWLSPSMQQIWRDRRVSSSEAEQYRWIPNLARRHMYSKLHWALVGHVWDQLSRQCAVIGYERRSPMYSRRFIEFAFSLPEHMKLRASTQKFIHVNSLRGLLPEKVLNRTDKAMFIVAYVHQFQSIGSHPLDFGTGESHENVSKSGINKLLERFWMAEGPPRGELEIWSTYLIESLLGILTSLEKSEPMA